MHCYVLTTGPCPVALEVMERVCPLQNASNVDWAMLEELLHVRIAHTGLRGPNKY
jgi:hypothetical protein